MSEQNFFPLHRSDMQNVDGKDDASDAVAVRSIDRESAALQYVGLDPLEISGVHEVPDLDIYGDILYSDQEAAEEETHLEEAKEGNLDHVLEKLTKHYEALVDEHVVSPKIQTRYSSKFQDLVSGIQGGYNARRNDAPSHVSSFYDNLGEIGTLYGNIILQYVDERDQGKKIFGEFKDLAEDVIAEHCTKRGLEDAKNCLRLKETAFKRLEARLSHTSKNKKA